MIKDLYDSLPNFMKTPVVLFRGFKFEKTDDNITLQDVRNIYYKDVDPDTMMVFESKGFIKGATYLLMKSDERKIELYKEMIDGHEGLINENLNPRKKQEYLNSIERYKDQIKYYVSQVRKWRIITKK